MTGPGVITSWAFRASNAGPSTARLRIFHPTGTANGWKVAAESADHLSPTGSAQVIPARIPVVAGDVLGLRTGTDGARTSYVTQTGDVIGTAPGMDPQPGTTFTGDTNDFYRVNVTATVEPDADADGYGDETQDQCPADASTAGPCQADLSLTSSVDAQSARVGDTLTYSLAVTNPSRRSRRPR